MHTSITGWCTDPGWQVVCWGSAIVGMQININIAAGRFTGGMIVLHSIT